MTFLPTGKMGPWRPALDTPGFWEYIRMGDAGIKHPAMDISVRGIVTILGKHKVSSPRLDLVLVHSIYSGGKWSIVGTTAETLDRVATNSTRAATSANLGHGGSGNTKR